MTKTFRKDVERCRSFVFVPYCIRVLFFRIIWRFQKKFVTLPQTAEYGIVCLPETYAKHINIITKSIKPNEYETKIYLSAFPDAYVHLRGK